MYVRRPHDDDSDPDDMKSKEEDEDDDDDDDMDVDPILGPLLEVDSDSDTDTDDSGTHLEDDDDDEDGDFFGNDVGLDVGVRISSHTIVIRGNLVAVEMKDLFNDNEFFCLLNIVYRYSFSQRGNGD